jgi:hypothetical protein
MGRIGEWAPSARSSSCCTTRRARRVRRAHGVEWTHRARSAAASTGSWRAHGRHAGVAVTRGVAGRGRRPQETGDDDARASRARRGSARRRPACRREALPVRDGERWSVGRRLGRRDARDEQEGGPPHADVRVPARSRRARRRPTDSSRPARRVSPSARPGIRARTPGRAGGPARRTRLGLGADAYELARRRRARRAAPRRGAAAMTLPPPGGDRHRASVRSREARSRRRTEGVVAVRLVRPERCRSTSSQAARPSGASHRPRPRRVAARREALHGRARATRRRGGVARLREPRRRLLVVSIRTRRGSGPATRWQWRATATSRSPTRGEHAEPRHHVRVARDGTLVELAGDDPELLAGLARSLVPAPTEPPRLAP